MACRQKLTVRHCKTESNFRIIAENCGQLWMANSWKLRSQRQIRRQIPLLSSLPLDWVAFWCLRYLINISPFSKLQTKIPRYGSDVFLVKWSSVQLVYANKEATGDDKQLIRTGRSNLCFLWYSGGAPMSGQSGGSLRRQFESVSRNCVTSRIMTTLPSPLICPSVWKSKNLLNLSCHQIRGGTCLSLSGSQMELSVFSCEPNYQTSSNLRMHITLGHPVHLHTSTHS